MILTNSGVLKLMQRIKSFIASQLNTKAPSVHTHSISEIDNLAAQLGGGYSKSEVDTLLNGKADSSHTHTKSQITDFPTIPTKTSDLTNDSGFLTSHQSLANYVTLNGAQTISGDKTFSGLTKTTGKSPYSLLEEDANNAIYNLETTSWGPDTANRPSSSYGTLLSFNTEGNVHTSVSHGWISQLGIGTSSRLHLRTKTNVGEPWSSWKEFITTDGGSVLSGSEWFKTTNNSYQRLGGGTDASNGAWISVCGGTWADAGIIFIAPNDGNVEQIMWLYPNGTWTWPGQPIQYTSDQRLKQQISKIDNALLDAWEDVELVQFKYNDAVNEKGTKARLHTGYVVQQIDDACKSHNLDISEYGLYCHEDYPEETEEVEVEQEDGTIKKETKVIREASEHYSLRYTETLVVECAYLRRENSRLKERLSKIEKLLNI